MRVAAKLQFLGTGGATGVPIIGCHCSVCTSSSPYNKRLRPSALLTWGKNKVLIDCGPDFRTQALSYGIDTLDGVILTHAHNDHIAGIDDLRIYYLIYKKAIPCLLSKETADDLKVRFAYIFGKPRSQHQLTAKITLQCLEEERGETSFAQLKVRYFSYEQGNMAVNGFRFGNLAYVSDIREYPQSIYEDLEGVETLIISALRHEPSPIHFHVKEAVAFAERVRAKQTWLTHVGHELEHDETNAGLPPHVRMAHDGLILRFEAEIEEESA